MLSSQTTVPQQQQQHKRVRQGRVHRHLSPQSQSVNWLTCSLIRLSSLKTPWSESKSSNSSQRSSLLALNSRSSKRESKRLRSLKLRVETSFSWVCPPSSRCSSWWDITPSSTWSGLDGIWSSHWLTRRDRARSCWVSSTYWGTEESAWSMEDSRNTSRIPSAESGRESTTLTYRDTTSWSKSLTELSKSSSKLRHRDLSEKNLRISYAKTI